VANTNRARLLRPILYRSQSARPIDIAKLAKLRSAALHGLPAQLPPAIGGIRTRLIFGAIASLRWLGR